MKSSSFLLMGAVFVGVLGLGAHAAGLTVSTLAGDPRTPAEADGNGFTARFTAPNGVAVDASGAAWVVDHGAGSLRKVTADGTVTTSSAKFFSPYGVAADASGNVYVTDALSFVVDRVAADGTVTVVAGTQGSRGTADGNGASAQFSGPTGIAVDTAGNLYIADTNRDSGGAVLRRIDANGNVTTIATGFVDIRGVAVDSSGNIFVADSGDNTIRQVNASSGAISLYAGIPARTGADDGAALSSRFNLPSALVVDGNGNVFVADYGNSAIREITPGGTVSTVAGEAVVTGSADGVGSNARFYTPAGIALSPSGTLYIADTGNDTLRVATGATAPQTLSQTSTGGGSAGAAVSGQASVINLSVRSMVGGASGNLIVGFVTTGSGSKNLLIRGIGPALANFGVSGALAQPQLTLYSGGGATLASNSGWDASNGAALAHTMSTVGAFALPAGSADTALQESLSPGVYTAQISAANGTSGVALAEIYDVDGAASSSHLINVSSRSEVTPGNSGALVSGFVVGGSGSQKLLIRGIGPALTGFGVPDALSKPQLTVFNSAGTAIATQSGWGSDTTVASTAAAVGAFGLQPNTADCAVVLTLSPGAYTAQVTSADGSSGSALVEIYTVQ